MEEEVVVREQVKKEEDGKKVRMNRGTQAKMKARKEMKV